MSIQPDFPNSLYFYAMGEAIVQRHDLKLVSHPTPPQPASDLADEVAKLTRELEAVKAALGRALSGLTVIVEYPITEANMEASHQVAGMQAQAGVAIEGVTSILLPKAVNHDHR